MVVDHSATVLSIVTKQTLDLLESTAAEAKRKTSEIRITPDGKFVYCATRRNKHTHGTLTAYSVDQTTGLLTLIDRYNTSKVVAGFDVDSSGQFLIIAGQNEGTSTLYKIGSDGTLTEKQSFSIGSKPFWVLAVEVTSSSLSTDNLSKENKKYSINSNPFKDTFTILFEEGISENDVIEVIDTKGAIVAANQIIENRNKVTIDLSSAPGNYFLKVIQKGRTSISKLIVIFKT